jgi:signal transduction histidine kinase/CheY-like chemotaxis protein
MFRFNKFFDCLRGLDLQDNIAKKTTLASSMVANAICVLCFVVCAIFATISYFNNNQTLLLFFGIHVLIYFGVFALLRTQHKTLTNLLLFFSLNSGMLILTDLLGKSSLIQMIFLVLLCFPFFFFPAEKRVTRYLSMLFPIGSFYFLEISNYSTFTRLELSESFYESIRLGVLATAFVANFVILEVFSKMKDEKEIIANLLEDEKLLSEILNQERLKAEDASQAKSNFLAIMSHEFRTPINGILGASSLLQIYDLNEEQKECSDIIQTSTNRLVNIVNNILDFSKLDAGEMTLDIQVVDLKSILNDIETSFLPQLHKHELTMLKHFGEGITLGYNGDAIKIRQVLIQIISNAIKFSKNSDINISVTLGKNSPRGQIFNILVQDQGIGIPEEKMAHIFEAFTQADSSFTREAEGIGLGLALSKKLLELMGGSIKIERRDKGVQVHISLLLKKSSLEENKISAGGGKIYNVLVVEDNEIHQKLMTAMLDRMNHQHMVTHSGENALDLLLSDNTFDLILMDLALPLMDGFECTRSIRNLPNSNLCNIPIIALTTNQSKNHQAEMLAAGIDDFLVKPMKPLKLKAILAKLFPQTEF